MINLFPTVESAIRATKHFLLRYGQLVKIKTWQSKNVEDTLQGMMFSALNWNFTANLPTRRGGVSELARQTKCNREWADAQFDERVGGVPLNPGESYKLWPYYKNNPTNDKFRDENEKFSHTYMERFWPKHAGDWLNDRQRKEAGATILELAQQYEPLLPAGIRYMPGDFLDVVELLEKDSHTRRAYLPIWFPEDTGAKHGGRVPCTLGYHFQIRNNELNITYFIRACDYFRHFRDDVYLAGRLVYRILNMLGEGDSGISPGTITMHIIDLHIFGSEIKLLQNEPE